MKSGRKMRIAARLMVMVLSLAIMVTMMPLSGDFAFAEDSTALSTQKPAVVVTGKGLIGNNGAYTKANVSIEKSYTMDELKELGNESTVNGKLYSSLNSKNKTNYYKVDGVKVKALLGKGDEDEVGDSVTVYSSDPDYKAEFEYSGANTGIDAPRYFFDPDQIDYPSPVPATLAWAEFKASSVADAQSSTPEALDTPKLFVGQTSADEMNNSLFIKETNKIVMGGEIEEKAVTVDGKSYTRAELLQMDRAERSYVYMAQKKGQDVEVTDKVRGVPLAALLTQADDEDGLEIKSADGMEINDLKVKDIRSGNYILAYEMARTSDGETDLYGIYDSDKNDASVYGVIRLYGDDTKPLKMVSTITVKKPEPEPEPTPAPVINKVTKPGKTTVTIKAGKKKATVKWKKVSGAAGYEVWRSTKKNKGFKKVKTVNSGKTVKFVNKKLKAKKTYYYKVRAFKKDGKKKVYGSFSKARKVRIKK